MPPKQELFFKSLELAIQIKGPAKGKTGNANLDEYVQLAKLIRETMIKETTTSAKPADPRSKKESSISNLNKQAKEREIKV
jgi:hypothetical protein